MVSEYKVRLPVSREAGSWLMDVRLKRKAVAETCACAYVALSGNVLARSEVRLKIIVKNGLRGADDSDGERNRPG